MGSGTSYTCTTELWARHTGGIFGKGEQQGSSTPKRNLNSHKTLRTKN